ncbi:DUF5779 family protein [Halovenus rubra]|uniref:DUF5779 family protein n=2 Tax=Halovenus rubra TaxID=869890 RepID=A0ABD5X7G0_9EURY|nr:DUF5779 family protein [Halovenus rubra]
MSDFDGLDLQAVEDQMDDESDDNRSHRVVLGVLDGTTQPSEWVEVVADGGVLVLNIAGDLNQLASEFASDINDAGGNLVHFRDFLIVSPPDVEIDAERLD